MQAQKNSLEYEIYRKVLDAVSEQRLPPGAKLREEALAKVFNTSRTTVRRVLARLEHDRVVSLIPNRGAYIASPSIEEARQVFETRRIVESAAALSAAGRLGDKDVTKLQLLANSAHEAHETENRGQEVRRSADFHREIARLGGNTILLEVIEELLFRSSLIVAQYQRSNAPDCSFNEHLNIVDALHEGDGELAARLMTEHLDQVEAGLDLRTPLHNKVDLGEIFG